MLVLVLGLVQVPPEALRGPKQPGVLSNGLANADVPPTAAPMLYTGKHAAPRRMGLWLASSLGSEG